MRYVTSAYLLFISAVGRWGCERASLRNKRNEGATGGSGEGKVYCKAVERCMV